MSAHITSTFIALGFALALCEISLVAVPFVGTRHFHFYLLQELRKV